MGLLTAGLPSSLKPVLSAAAFSEPVDFGILVNSFGPLILQLNSALRLGRVGDGPWDASSPVIQLTRFVADQNGSEHNDL